MNFHFIFLERPICAVRDAVVFLEMKVFVPYCSLSWNVAVQTNRNCCLKGGGGVVELWDKNPIGAGRMKKNKVDNQNIASVKKETKLKQANVL